MVPFPTFPAGVEVMPTWDDVTDLAPRHRDADLAVDI
jgi:hypothetical protein